jgi:hypothetical protein
MFAASPMRRRIWSAKVRETQITALARRIASLSTAALVQLKNHRVLSAQAWL